LRRNGCPRRANLNPQGTCPEHPRFAQVFAASDDALNGSSDCSWPPDRLRKIKGCSNMIYLSEKGVKFVLDIAIFLAGLAVIAIALYLTH
jgi:hypothetical protein